VNPVSLRHRLWLIAFLVFWATYGMVGRDAWQGDEALILGDILAWQADDGLPVSAASPLYTLLAGLTAQGLRPWFDLQDAARLASTLFSLAALLLTGLAGRELFGKGFGSVAAIALMGAFGLLLRAHALLPGIALLAGYALLLYGVALSRRHARSGGAALGLALAALVLVRGVPDLIAGLLIAVLPLLSREWRERSYRRALVAAGLWLGAALGIWLALLALQDTHALAAWWQQATAGMAPNRSPLALLNLLAWFAWPLWPLALWTVWNEQRRLGRSASLHPVLIATGILVLLALWPAHSPHEGALPLLVPLALLATYGVDSLRRGAAQGFYWFGVLCFLFFLLTFWLYFAAIQWGWPTGIARHMARLAPGYATGSVASDAIAIAAVVSLAWLAATPLFPRAKVRPILVWATGMLLTWVLVISLFKPWAEANWGFRPLLADLAAHLPANACLTAEVDPAMTVMLRYHLGERFKTGGDCRFRLIKTGRDNREMDPAVWSGYRPRYKQEVYRLYDHGG
jgi:4-amino-4-deoxy-L-arabinose transferase-like glycosyltransferase